MESVKFKFNHKESTTMEACGLTEEQTEELINEMNKEIAKYNTGSEVVEGLGKNFSSTSLAFILFHKIQGENEPDEKDVTTVLMEIAKKLEEQRSE